MKGLMSYLMDDTNQMRLAGIGSMLMQMDQGETPDMRWLGQVQGMEQDAAFKQQLQGGQVPGMDKFSQEERQLLLTMPPSVAQKMIAERLFAKPDPWAGVQEINGQLVRMGANGPEVVGDYRTPQAADPWAGTKVIGGKVVTMGPDGPQEVADFGGADTPNLQTFNGPDGTVYQFNPKTGETKKLTGGRAPEMETRQVKMPDGSEVLIERPKGSNADWTASRIPQGGTSGTGAQVKLTEAQAKTTLFQNMQAETTPVIADIETIWDPANIGDAIARNTPVAGNFFESEQGKLYRSASTAWAEGALRITTGAAATEPEIDRVLRTYFAQPGDTPNVVAFKKSMRDMFNRSIDASLGQGNKSGAKLELPMEFAKRYQLKARAQGNAGAGHKAPIKPHTGPTEINGYKIEAID